MSATTQKAETCPRCAVARNVQIPGRALRCLNCGAEWNICLPFPVGTVRGPYHYRGETQFLVQGKGGWVPFIRAGVNGEAEARQAAEKYAEALKD